MRCPACGAIDTRVVDSRSAKEGSEIRRRRLCDACAHRFTTFERAEQSLLIVIKKDNRREPWDREKILRGLSKACEKRPVSVGDIENLVDQITDDLLGTGESEIPSKAIGERIMAGLRNLDEVAYVRFASVYRAFEDVGEFMNEVTELVREKKKSQNGAGS